MSDIESPREMTSDEVQDEFLRHIHDLIEMHAGQSPYDIHDALMRLASSILMAIDGDGPLPAWILAPCPFLSDMHCRKKKGLNYFPQNSAVGVAADISGDLHIQFIKMELEEEGIQP